MSLSSTTTAFAGLLALGAFTLFPPSSEPTGSEAGLCESEPMSSPDRQCSVALPAEPAPAPEPAPEPAEATDRPTIEVAFVLDTTGSMGGLLEGAKAKIWSIASRIMQGQPAPRLRVGLVGYRDREDAYVTRVHPLRDDLDAVYSDLRSFQAAGGGDTPEDVSRALRDAVESMQWSSGDNVLKVIYVVGDAPPKRYPYDFDAAHWIRRAREQGIVVNTIRCGSSSETQANFQKLAQLGGGSYFTVAQDGGVAAVSTPYDKEIHRLEAESGELALIGGAVKAQRKAVMRREATRRLSEEASADRSTFHLAAGASASRWAPEEAVDLSAEPEALDDLKDTELPTALRPMAPDERREVVRSRAKRRAEVDQKLRELTERRQRFLDAKPKADDGVDNQISDDLRRRASSLGIRYEASPGSADPGK